MTTKTVQGFFGPKDITREEFVKQWADHFGQFYHLPETSEQMAELDAMKARLQTLAGEKWDKLK
jgi:hypothetical protein